MIHFTNPSTSEWILFVATLLVGFYGGWRSGRGLLRRKHAKAAAKKS